MSLSGFCQAAPGARVRASDHAECVRRQEAGLLGPCDCPDDAVVVSNRKDAA